MVHKLAPQNLMIASPDETKQENKAVWDVEIRESLLFFTGTILKNGPSII